jgi:hypothetical protein
MFFPGVLDVRLVIMKLDDIYLTFKTQYRYTSTNLFHAKHNFLEGN